MENQCQIHNAEYNKLAKILNYRLSNKFKKLGILGALFMFLTLVVYKHFGANDIVVKDVFRNLILVSLLMASLSREKLEDEYISHIRSQSHVIAFVCAIGYAISLPIIVLPLDILITKIRGEGMVGFHEVSAFEVIFILIGFQLLFFSALKRFGRV